MLNFMMFGFSKILDYSFGKSLVDFFLVNLEEEIVGRGTSSP